MVTWNAETDAQLFLAVLAAHNITVDNAKVAQIFGHNATPRAIRERISKLRNLSKEVGNSKTSSSGDENITPPKTPSPRKPRKNQKVLDGGIRKTPVKKERTLKWTPELDEFGFGF